VEEETEDNARKLRAQHTKTSAEDEHPVPSIHPSTGVAGSAQELCKLVPVAAATVTQVPKPAPQQVGRQRLSSPCVFVPSARPSGPPCHAHRELNSRLHGYRHQPICSVRGAQRLTARTKGTVRTTHRNEDRVVLDTHVYGLSNEPIAVRAPLQRIAGWDTPSGAVNSAPDGLRSALTGLDLRVSSILSHGSRQTRSHSSRCLYLCHHERRAAVSDAAHAVGLSVAGQRATQGGRSGHHTASQ
jgi:hypothetical protein